MRSSDRTECIKSLIKLKQQEEVIEKSLDNFLDSSKLEPEILRCLKNEKRSNTTDRLKSASSLRMAVKEITNDLHAIKSVISALQEDRKIDTDSFKEKLTALAEKIREIKKDSSLETLANEEIDLDRDLRAFSLALHKYEMRKCASSSSLASRESSKSKNSASTDCQDYSGLRDFYALVAKTGHTQGWTEEDHFFFLTIRKKSHSVPAMVAAIRKRFPDLSSERIVNHETWYKIYLDLREKQRQTIRDWRQKKETERVSKLAEAQEDEIRCRRNPNERKVSSRETIHKESEFVEATSKNTGKSVTTKEPCKCNKKEELNKWRMNKENARYLEAERAKSAIESREARKESCRLARAKQLKAAVEAYRENKTSSSMTSVEELGRIASNAEVAELMKCFRRQDEEFLRRRRALLLSKKSPPSAPVRQKMSTQSNEKSTLLKPTKVWLEKCKADEEARVQPSQQVFYVKHIQKLGTCNWRNRESA